MRLRHVLPIAILAAPAVAAAQSPPASGWKFSGQLTGVWTSGNSESSTFGLGSTLRRIGAAGELKLEAGGIRTDASKTTRRAVGSSDAYVIEEDEVRATTAETYFARARYDHKTGGSSVLFAGVDVLRNTFAGIDSRVLLALGAGHLWVDEADMRLKSNYGVTYTFQHDVVENPFLKTSFPGTRVSVELQRRITGTTRLESLLVGDLNFSDTGDTRLDFTNALPVSVSRVISLKPSLQLLWRNQPALREVDLFDALGQTTGERVVAPFEKLDSFFTLAVVVTL